MERLRGSAHSAFPVVDQRGDMVGLLTLDDLRAHLGDRTLASITVAADLCRANPATTRPDDTLEAALDRMTREGVDHLPVVDAVEPRRVLGILTLHDLLGIAGRIDDEGVQTGGDEEPPPRPLRR